jgi:hypothetical protein
VGSTWLRDLPAALAGVPDVGWYDDWENRARSSGGYDALYAIGVHHTASSASPANDMAYMWANAQDRPIGAIYLARDGAITVGAAGATNTQGKGGPYTCSRGTIPLDSGNRYMLSVEAANNGTGERWPDAQLDAYLNLCAALCAHYHLDPARDVVAHFEWTTRKVDPAGPVRYAPAASSWNMGAFRDDVTTCTTPPTPLEEADVEVVEIRPTDANAVFLGYRTTQATAVRSGATDGKWRFILWCEWVDGRDPAQLLRLQAYRDCGAPVYSLSVHELANTTLLGPVPLGDDRHQWTGEEFGNLI